MEESSELNTFTKILTEKGYSGYFHTKGAYAGKLKESISEYLNNCRKVTDRFPQQYLLLTGYLQWSGEDKPHVECMMRVKYQNNKFFLSSMEVSKKDRFGQLLKKTELTNLSAITAPTAVQAVALVNEVPKQEVHQSPKRFRL